LKKNEPKDEYRLAFEIHDEKAHVIVYEPIISEEETEKRLNELKEAVRVFWTNYYRRKAREEKRKAIEEKQNNPSCVPQVTNS
jgi:hypothetical protein